MRVYHHCVNISRIVVSAELTCDELWRKVAGWKKDARLKRPIPHISRACKPSPRSTFRTTIAEGEIVWTRIVPYYPICEPKRTRHPIALGKNNNRLHQQPSHVQSSNAYSYKNAQCSRIMDRYHWDAIYFWHSIGYVSSLETIVPFYGGCRYGPSWDERQCYKV